MVRAIIRLIRDIIEIFVREHKDKQKKSQDRLPLIDVTNEYKGSTKAERWGSRVIILRSLIRWYEVEYLTFSPYGDNAFYTHTSWINKSDIDLNKSLFKQLDWFV